MAKTIVRKKKKSLMTELPMLTKEQVAEQKLGDAIKKHFGLEGHPAEYVLIAGSTHNLVHIAFKGDRLRLVGMMQRATPALLNEEIK